MMAVRSQRASRNQVFRISCTQGGIHHENISEICCHRCCCSSFHSKSMRPSSSWTRMNRSWLMRSKRLSKNAPRMAHGRRFPKSGITENSSISWKTRKTLIKSQNQILYGFLYIVSSTFSLNSSLFAPSVSSLCIKNPRMKSDNDLISVSLKIAYLK